MGLPHYSVSPMQEPLVTPHIDRVLHCYQHQAERGGRDGRQGRTEREGGGGSSSGTVHGNSEEGGYESRLMQLERQLSQLLQKNKVKTFTFKRHLVHMAFIHTGCSEKSCQR